MTLLTIGGSGSGAQPVTRSLSRAAHFFQTARSDSSLMKTPPTTERAWNPTCFASFVQYQSDIGTRSGDAFKKSYRGTISASNSPRVSAIVAVQTVQSSLA